MACFAYGFRVRVLSLALASPTVRSRSDDKAWRRLAKGRLIPPAVRSKDSALRGDAIRIVGALKYGRLRRFGEHGVTWPDGAARRALTKLGVQWEPTEAEKGYNQGRSTQVPVNPVVHLKGRVGGSSAMGMRS